jgi:hypothetical protein
MTIAAASEPNTNKINESADFWRYDIGVNVIPADTINKKPLVQWSEWQDKPIPEWQHEKWKAEGMFLKGIAIIPGKVWHRKDRNGLYFTFIDADKQKAIDELCSRNGKTISLQEMAQKFLVEQHTDNLLTLLKKIIVINFQTLSKWRIFYPKPQYDKFC